MESKLYVGNLAYNVTEGDLQRLFAQAGEVKEVALIMDRTTRQSKGFGFVEMTTDADAQKAIEMFNNYELDGRNITVSIARPREERGGGGYRGGRGYGGNRTGYGTHRGGGRGGRGGGRGGRY
jgi:RNA recognition motif-containing protein